MLPPGTQIGRFKILAPLGAGGMGEVYRARDPQLGREIAVKVLPSIFASDPDRVRRFEQEAHAAAMLSHPNILTVYETGVHEGSPFLATELLQGQSLRQRLDQDAIPLLKALDYAQQIARGLGAAHERGVTHRDLKPENLFITRDGTVKILDFGLAKFTPEGTAATTMDPRTRPGQLLGTASYMSPEQLQAKPADHRSDIFAFGLVLYEMIAGKHPFQAPTLAEMMARIAGADAPTLAASPALDPLVRRCLEKNPEERFQSARDIGFALQSLAPHASSASGVAVSAALPRPHPARRWIGAALAVAGLLIAVAAGYLFGRKPAVQPVYRQITYRRGTVYKARFGPDGQTVVYSARWDARPVDVFDVRREYPESHSLDLACHLLSVSSTGELALLREPHFIRHYQWAGTLAVAPLGGGAPRDLLENVVDADYAGDGRLAAVAEDGGSQVLEFPPGKPLYRSPGWITHPRFSPKGDRIAFLEHLIPNDDQGSVVMVDMSGKKTVLSEGWTGAAEGLAWSPADNEVWFSASKEGEASLAIYAVSTEGKLRPILSGPQGLIVQDLAPDGRVLLASQSYRTEVRVSLDGGRVERDVSWLEGSNFPFLSGDARWLMFSEEAAPSGYTVCLRKTDGSPVVQLGHGTPNGFSPDGKWALVLDASKPRQLVVVPTGAGQSKALPPGPVEGFWQSGWFPDGRRILIVGHEHGKPQRAYVQDISGGDPRPILPDGYVPFPRVISPDGKLVPCRAPGEADARPWMLCNLEGGAPRELTGLPAYETPIRWTPDGKFLYSYYNRLWPWRVMKVSVTDGSRQPWKEVTPSDPVGLDWLLGVDITPDGQSLSYAFLRQLNGLFVVQGLR